MKTTVERASAYLAKMPVSVQGGEGATFAAAQALVKGFSLSVEEALPLLLAWNHGCQPPWSEADLRCKLHSAASTSSKAEGYLLADRPAAARDRTSADFPNEAERRAWQRRQWPELRRLSREELLPIARLRGIPWGGLHIARSYGLIKGCQLDGHDCYAVGEDRFVQVRRCDGLPFTNAEGRAINAKNLPGSEGAFVGRGLLFAAPHVLLVEGAVGLLEALTAYALVDMQPSWTALAATSTSSRLERDPTLLKALAGRHVRIVPHVDAAGLNAAASWLAELQKVGATVDIQELPSGCKDLGALLTKAEAHQDELNSLFQIL
ncbi:MAG: hypothetical protein K9N47_19670 [Prosthecobacter sp.]|uniref:hypothetical protein n=1 Tax=Prosthecobacter sp. TaxID=1965333 RepID=UPI0025DDCB0A|nr:hypothetical protein [Prosthecobacter sp.]MCF7788350.1 hypothetical protein [Prosthecobacter sp.]